MIPRGTRGVWPRPKPSNPADYQLEMLASLGAGSKLRGIFGSNSNHGRFLWGHFVVRVHVSHQIIRLEPEGVNSSFNTKLKPFWLRTDKIWGLWTPHLLKHKHYFAYDGIITKETHLGNEDGVSWSTCLIDWNHLRLKWKCSLISDSCWKCLSDLI